MINKKDCCGCTACVHICPVKCIEMQADNEGFLYPAVDNEKCIHCRKCEEVCPVRHTDNGNTAPRTFVGYNTNSKVREQSSSGGVFSLAAEWILNQNGAVFGAAFNENFQVCHIAAETKEELAELRGSKYVQSSMGDAYLLAQRYLQNGRRVLFTGTACQIAGLGNYLNKDYENLYTVDVLCHGVPSPAIWKMYLEHQEKQYNSPIKKIDFRSKENGWKKYSVSVEFADNRRYRVNFYKDAFMQMFLGNIALRPSCYDCRFKDIPRVSDMTIGDSWGIDGYMPDMDDDMGTSVIIVNSPKGQEMFDAVKGNLRVKEAGLDKALPITAESRRSVTMHPKRERFFAGLEKGENFQKLCGYLKKSLIQRGLCFMQYVLIRLGIKR